MYNIPRKQSGFDDVGDFHTKFGLPVSDNEPIEVDEEVLKFRINFLGEELEEFIEAAGYFIDHMGNLKPQVSDGRFERDHPKMFDALMDLVYVAYGTAHMFGYPWDEGWARVQQANMAKVRAQSDASDSKRGSSFDVVKPPGWTPPDIEGLLAHYGWDCQ